MRPNSSVSMKSGDRLLIYETGNVKSAVGTATVVSVDTADAKNPRVSIKAGKPLGSPVTLAEIKANKLFSESPPRMPYLSAIPD